MKKCMFNVFLISLVASTITFSGCRKGENDPFFTLHSRDGRMSQNWNLIGLTGSVVNTTGTLTTTTKYDFDGSKLYITEDGLTSSYDYTYDMNILDDGSVVSKEVKTDPATGVVLVESTKTSFWFWGDDEKNKTSVNLDLTGLLADYQSYDIPRLAWNDMTLAVSYSDNTTNDVDGTASSESVEFTLYFAVDITTTTSTGL